MPCDVVEAAARKRSQKVAGDVRAAFEATRGFVGISSQVLHQLSEASTGLGGCVGLSLVYGNWEEAKPTAEP